MDVAGTYHHLIDGIVGASGMSDKTVHMHAGMAIYLLAQMLFRTRRGSIDALLVVLVAELANELMDRLYWGSWRWGDTAGDIAATLFWPFACAVVSTWRRRRWARAESRRRAVAELLAPAGGHFARPTA